MPKESSGTQVVATRLSPDEVKRVQAVAGKLSARASGVSVTVAETIAIIVRRELPRFEIELGLAPKPSKTAKSTAA